MTNEQEKSAVRLQKAWRQPELRKLAISATASCQPGGKTVVSGNEGGGGGKGDCGDIS
jgi:hypothetical protein